MTMNYEEIMETLEKGYKVEDIIHPEAEIIFVLESPHVKELQYQVPVSGSSGASMTKTLFGLREGLPIGRFLKENQGEAPYHLIGLMNICQVPMQSKAYSHPQLEITLAEFFAQLEKVRTSNGKTEYKEERLNQLQKVILEKFKERLATIDHEKVLFVPCGRFAEKFFRMADPNKKIKTLSGVPHPSYNSWSKEKYAKLIGKLKETVQMKMNEKRAD